MQGDYAAQRNCYRNPGALSRDRRSEEHGIATLDALAYLAMRQAEYAEAEALRASGGLRTRDDAAGCSTPASAVWRPRSTDRGTGPRRASCTISCSWSRRAGNTVANGICLTGIGRAECDERRCDLALKHLAEGMTILHGLGDRPGVIESLDGHAGVAAATAAPRRAVRLWGAADALRQETGRAGQFTRASSSDRQ